MEGVMIVMMELQDDTDDDMVVAMIEAIYRTSCMMNKYRYYILYI